MKNIIKLAMSAVLAFGCAYIANSQACVGENNTIQEKNTSSALGANNMVYGKASTAIGQSNTVSVSTSTNPAYAIGYSNQATAKRTFAFGEYNTVTKAYSFAIGSTNTVNANTSVAIGCWIKNTVDHGITIGFGNQRSAPLLNNTDGIMMGMNSDKPTFYISSSPDAGKTGKVGIGNVTSPQTKLHIKADYYPYGDGEDADILLEPTKASNKAAIYFINTDNYISVSSDNKMCFSAQKFSFGDGGITLSKNAATMNYDIAFKGPAGSISVGQDKVMSFSSGKVGIGCENNVEGFALAVKGGVVSTEMSVMDVGAWPDYVFSGDYKRMSLYELERYIDSNHHLPEVPSAEEVSANGINLGEMNAILLQKVEELTLHVIELQKQIDIQQDKIDLQQNEIDELKAK